MSNLLGLTLGFKLLSNVMRATGKELKGILEKRLICNNGTDICFNLESDHCWVVRLKMRLGR